MSDMNGSKYIDLEGGLARVRGNQKLYARMLQMFLTSTEFDAFETALQENDLNRAAEVAHGIKGMTGNLSLTAVFEASNALMDDLRKGNLDQELVDTYRSALVETKKEVEAFVAQ